MNNIKLYYVHDPMCSWCWAFRPILLHLRNHLSEQIQWLSLLGGLAKDSSEPMPEQTKQFVQGQWHKIPQIGGVVIGDHVEIGACTTIDRGALGDTVIADHVILDNNIQIAHNVQIGEGTAIAACVGIAGSAKIGRHCTIAGAVGIAGHVEIADNVHFTGMAMVTKSVSAPGVYSSGTGLLPNGAWRKSSVRFKQLDEMAKRIQKLEKQVAELNE